MKVVSEKEIKVKSKTYESIKKPTPKNQDSGFVSINESELNKLTINDKLKLIVLDQEDNMVVTRVMKYEEVQHRLQRFWGSYSPYRLLKY
jgi:hypothetical protein